ncbi:porin [Achromobacter aloeverae]|uniref:Porin n=1 Tax=Achromobacter aloeverae TaxID=1750518 RepID=A0A4Q1HKA6_9BURK|nr:porin [Achromobacter aloeverae]RXN90369.1 porin [Achromobacter aloeverae]
MKKTLLALGLTTACAGVAHAETSVTLYGLIDAGVAYERIRGDGFHASRIGETSGTSSGSRWGLRGTEDLGDGLSAVFTLENGFTVTNGKSAQNSRMFGRQATVGLDSTTWGRLEFGRQTNMASKLFGQIDPFGLSYNSANMGTTFSAMNTMRVDNLVLYQTPTVNGFKFGLGYSFNADDSLNDGSGKFPTGDNNRELTTGLSYSNGPLFLAASYDRLDPTNDAVGGKTSARPQQYALGGYYDFEVVKIGAAVSQTRDGWFVGQSLATSPGAYYKDFGNYRSADGFTATSTLLAVTVPVGAATSVFGSWQRADPNNSRLTGDDKTFNVYAAGLTYNLSKRTNLYAYASYANNYAFHDGVTDTVVATGIRHKF